MRDVLLACAASADGVVAVAELVERRGRGGDSLPVARASLSRTLRRLWRTGLVELGGRPEAWAFSAARKGAEKFRAMAESDADYRRVCRSRKESGFAPPKDRAAYRAEYLARAARPDVRARYVLITKQGRLTAALVPELTGTKRKQT